ncbi:YcbK family protein [Niveispirillum sp. KHB5.9]|uniref:YcbK family protein n=1 Tax=Niveispirillum sp. KHB5.9 TaxID=3400269 RepID=UPI003A88592D
MSVSPIIDLGADTGRRGFLRGLGGLFLGAGAAIAAPTIITNPADAAPVSAPRRQISFVSLHTREKLNVTYFTNGTYDRSALKDVNHMLRDWRTGEIGKMDPKLLDLLFQLRQRLRTEEPFQVISGYRCPKTNAMLASKSEGVATKSLHMEGKAIDITMAGRQLSRIRQEALNLKQGGVGIYSKTGFVHVDTGRVRQWGV